MEPEHIAHAEGDTDSWICLCFNTPINAGFYPCDSKGRQIEPTMAAGWEGLYLCDRCWRIIDQATLKVIGRCGAVMSPP